MNIQHLTEIETGNGNDKNILMLLKKYGFISLQHSTTVKRVWTCATIMLAIIRRCKSTCEVITVISIVLIVFKLSSSKMWTIKSVDNLMPHVNLMPQRIFFHETSTKGFLNSREACAVESAARAHPNWQINVLFTSPIKATYLKQFKNTFEELSNIRLRRINLIDFAKDTPVWSLVKDGRLDKSKWRVSHTSDVLRYLTLYRWAGIYLDLDVIVAKSLEGLSKNWAVWETKYNVAAGALSFSEDEIGRRFANASIRELERSFKGNHWGNNGPGVITRVLKKICTTKNILKMSAKTCSGFNVYGSEHFYAVKWQQAKNYFKANKTVSDAYGYHVWNKISHKYKIEKNSPYDLLAKRFCPSVYDSGTLS